MSAESLPVDGRQKAMDGPVWISHDYRPGKKVFGCWKRKQRNVRKRYAETKISGVQR